MICVYCRLLDHAEQALALGPLRLGPLPDQELGPHAQNAWAKLQACSASQEGFIDKQEIFKELMAWRQEIDSKKKILKGGFLRGLPAPPSIESIAAVSSPAT